MVYSKENGEWPIHTPSDIISASIYVVFLCNNYSPSYSLLLQFSSVYNIGRRD